MIFISLSQADTPPPSQDCHNDPHITVADCSLIFENEPRMAVIEACTAEAEAQHNGQVTQQALAEALAKATEHTYCSSGESPATSSTSTTTTTPASSSPNLPREPARKQRLSVNASKRQRNEQLDKAIDIAMHKSVESQETPTFAKSVCQFLEQSLSKYPHDHQEELCWRVLQGARKIIEDYNEEIKK